MIAILEDITINDVEASTIIMTETTTMKTIITTETIREEAGVAKIVEGGMTMKPSITCLLYTSPVKEVIASDTQENQPDRQATKYYIIFHIHIIMLI